MHLMLNLAVGSGVEFLWWLWQNSVAKLLLIQKYQRWQSCFHKILYLMWMWQICCQWMNKGQVLRCHRALPGGAGNTGGGRGETIHLEATYRTWDGTTPAMEGGVSGPLKPLELELFFAPKKVIVLKCFAWEIGKLFVYFFVFPSGNKISVTLAWHPFLGRLRL